MLIILLELCWTAVFDTRNLTPYVDTDSAAVSDGQDILVTACLLYTSPSPRDGPYLVCRLLLEKKKKN